MAPRSAKQNEKEKEPREPTAAERKAIEKYLIRSKAKPTVRFKVSNNEAGTEIQLDHPHESIGRALLMNAFGSTDANFVSGLIDQLTRAGKKLSEARLNFLVAVVNGIEPRDQRKPGLWSAVRHLAALPVLRAQAVRCNASGER
jgi:hypothetical protein